MSVELIGVKDMKRLLDELAPRKAKNLSKAVNHGVAAQAAKKAKSLVPKDTGTLKKSIKAKRRRGKEGQPVSDVIAESGKSVKNDGFYWRFVEYGTQTGMPATPFVQPARLWLEQNYKKIFNDQVIDKVSKAVKREQKRLQKT